MAPHQSLYPQLVARKSRFLPHHHRLLLHVDIQHELLRCPTGQTQSASLANGHELDGINGAQLRSGFVNDACGPKRNSVTEKRLASARLADETHILAVGLGGGAQTKFAGTFAYLSLGEMSDGEQRVGKLALIEHVHHVTLVLGRVGPAHNAPYAGRLSFDARMVTSCHGIKPEQSSTLRQAVELEVSIAFDTRIRRGAGTMGIDIGINDVRGEVVGKVEHQVVDAQLLSNATSIVHVADRTATGVALASP